MEWAVFKNSQAVKLQDIPGYSVDQIRQDIIEKCSTGNDARLRPVAFFTYNPGEGPCVQLICVLADDDSSTLQAARADLTGKNLYEAISSQVPSFHMFEREIYEECGIHPVGHPWLKPVRYAHDRADKKHGIKQYPFFNFEGEEVHEVAVGPVHAGVIEPGHFRFMCVGEKVNHLEIQLGYQHRGVEKLFLNGEPARLNYLAESIAGDSVIANVWAYSQAVESLGSVIISSKAELVRAFALEMERVAMHLADLSGLCNDVAYLMGSSVYGALRTLVINSLLPVCGSRFGRSLVCPGGVNYGISEAQKQEIKKTLKKVYKDTTRMSETMLSTPTVLSRFEQTGEISEDVASAIGMLGLAARASGLAIDTRVDQPFGIYKDNPVDKKFLQSGDVYARAYMRFLEIKDSIEYILGILEHDCTGGEDLKIQTMPAFDPGMLVISMVEGWRGEIAHAVITGNNGRFVKYKIKDPSLINWYGLALAVRHNGISDFPLCNKSFNLSYCGSDL